MHLLKLPIISIIVIATNMTPAFKADKTKPIKLELPAVPLEIQLLKPKQTKLHLAFL